MVFGSLLGLSAILIELDQVAEGSLAHMVCVSEDSTQIPVRPDQDGLRLRVPFLERQTMPQEAPDVGVHYNPWLGGATEELQGLAKKPLGFDDLV